MKLSIKVFRIIFSISLISILFLYIFSKTYLLKSFTNVEIEKAHTDTQVILKYIQNDILNLNSMNVDYARWDDTYKYINDRNNDYIVNNFTDTTSMALAKVNFIGITDSLGNIIYKKNIESQTTDIFTDDLSLSMPLNVSKLFIDNNTKNVMGIVMYNKVPILISAERITKSDGSGDGSSIFIFARYYDKNAIATINKNTHLNVELLPYNKGIISSSDSLNKDTFVKITNEKFITGYGLINNIFSKPSFFVQVTLQRDIFRKAQDSLGFYLLILIVTLILFSLGVFTLIHVLVVKKINTIKSIVEKVNSSQDLSELITLKGNDEISDLGFQFNNMFFRLKKSDETIFSLAYYDTLTGLPNRKKLLENISMLLENNNENFALLFIDLDNFKSINNNFGHEAGDMILQEVANRLKSNTGLKGISSRIGGDKFIVIIKDLKSSSSATEITEELFKVLSCAFIYNENVIYIGASIGISLFPEHGNSADILIKNANLAMYEVKNSEGYGYTLYKDSMNDKAIDKLEMKKILKNAMKNNEFITYYQPIIDLKAMKILSAESLIRWNRQGKIIPPIEFIPIAKTVGEIVEIDNWMLRNACTQCKKWQMLGVENFSISVNISYKQLIQLNFIELVKNIFDDELLDPKYLNLEITEDEAMEDPDLIIKILSQLKLMGIKISMDDFGTGYSSLSYINKLPIDTIKIDRSLIINLESNSKNKVIINSIVAMAHSLNIKVVAEGIETETEFAILKELQCDYIQGYLIGKPMIASDFQDNFIKFFLH